MPSYSKKIYVSVGTSLLSNNMENKQGIPPGAAALMSELENKDQFYRGSLNELTFLFDDQGKLEKLEPDGLRGCLEPFCSSFFEQYLRPNEVLKNLNRRLNHSPDAKDRLPAEISSLFFYYYTNKLEEPLEVLEEHRDRLVSGNPRSFCPKDKIYLVTTETSDAIYCAKVLEQMIQRLPIFNGFCDVEPVAPISDLNYFHPDQYVRDRSMASQQSSGLENLRSFFHEAQPFDVIIRTGGYKELCADLKFVAHQYELLSYYLFDRSTQPVRFQGKGLPVLDSLIEETSF